ncbi:FAD-dependent oxidoreductase [Bacillus sp. DX4.1]|uniref:FAD-dependent oxidoreductase n=1 Tax=Bacillus sp. DX4.1 TaxID=3055867 RepID=UPI00259FF947|nr:FAD-dependent oxidoreductase [Bacillus sp. DX4.1]MDM5186041.1 FAD-dependent oxidoreductase [Bacillus sp. DX4.1]
MRESRRIEGQYILQKEDVTVAKEFEDVIARSGYPIDIHTPSGKGMEIGWIKGEGAFDIPYRCLLPKKITNLLVAGRCMSASYEALATTRLTPSAMATGQAAGTATSLALDSKVNPADINIKQLQKELLKDDVVLN